MALEDKTMPQDASPDPAIAKEIESRLVDGKLPCTAAFVIAHELTVPASEVGKSADLMEVRLSRCQLGYFGYPNKQAWDQVDVSSMEIPDGLKSAIEEAQKEAGDVSCAKLWLLAATYQVPRLLVGYLADQAGVHVTPCQLGAF